MIVEASVLITSSKTGGSRGFMMTRSPVNLSWRKEARTADRGRLGQSWRMGRFRVELNLVESCRSRTNKALSGNFSLSKKSSARLSLLNS